MEDEGCANGNMHYDACGKNWNDNQSSMHSGEKSNNQAVEKTGMITSQISMQEVSFLAQMLSKCELTCIWFQFDGGWKMAGTSQFRI